MGTTFYENMLWGTYCVQHPQYKSTVGDRVGGGGVVGFEVDVITIPSVENPFDLTCISLILVRVSPQATRIFF